MRFLITLFLVILVSICFSQEENKDEPKIDKEKVKELLKKLSSEVYEEREKATEDLKALGLPVAPLIEEELKNKDNEPEAIWRMEKILSELRFLDMDYRNKKIKELLETTFNGKYSSHSIGSTLNYILYSILSSKKINFIASNEASTTRANVTYKGNDKVVDVLNKISEDYDLKYEIINGIVVIASEDDLKKFKENLKKLEEKTLPEGFNVLEKIPFSTGQGRDYYHINIHAWEKIINVRIVSRNIDFYNLAFSISDDIPFKDAFFSFLAMYNFDFTYDQKKEKIVIKNNKE